MFLRAIVNQGGDRLDFQSYDSRSRYGTGANANLDRLGPDPGAYYATAMERFQEFEDVHNMVTTWVLPSTMPETGSLPGKRA